MKKFYTNVYVVGRAYGGPEEGGWWYDYGTPIFEECTEHETFDDAMEMKQAVQNAYNDYNESMPPISNLDGDGHIDVYVEDHPAKAFPETRPYYFI